MTAGFRCITTALLLVFFLTAGNLFSAVPAYAGCGNPAGNEGDMIYNSAYHAMQYCNGSTWETIGKGTTIVGNCTGGCTTPNTSGYFVLSHGTFNGNLGGTSGADADCLADLTANNWNGKADATSRGLLIAGKVTAMAPVFYGCYGPSPNTNYIFAVSGDTGAGGASFTTDSSGNGPGDSNNWSGVTYFNGTYTYWTGQGGISNTLWGSCGYGDNNPNRCGNWTSSTSGGGYGGNYGSSNATDGGRFLAVAGADCSVARRILCFVSP
jgi:hypothetical protein